MDVQGSVQPLAHLVADPSCEASLAISGQLRSRPRTPASDPGTGHLALIIRPRLVLVAPDPDACLQRTVKR